MTPSRTPPSAESAIERLARRSVAATGWLLLAVVAGFAWAVQAAPTDAMQGPIQKVLYVHAPCAFAAYLGFITTALAGAVYLWRRDAAWDRLAASAAEVGVVFCALVILSGPIWARGTWGQWWSWDLRLILTLLLFLIYLAYLLLRSFTEDDERTARFAAVYGMAGLVVIPLNYFAIRLAGGRTIHPENLERGSLGDGMGMPFALGVTVALVAFFHLLARRVELAGLQARAEHAEAEQQALAGAPPWPTP